MHSNLFLFLTFQNIYIVQIPFSIQKKKRKNSFELKCKTFQYLNYSTPFQANSIKRNIEKLPREKGKIVPIQMGNFQPLQRQMPIFGRFFFFFFFFLSYFSFYAGEISLEKFFFFFFFFRKLTGYIF